MGVTGILRLFDIVLSLPTTSVFNERSFSHMKLIETKKTRMFTAALSELMIVKSETPGIDGFSPRAAIDKWLVTPRRVGRS